MLENLGLGVDAIPGHPERVGQEALEQPVMTDDLQRNSPALGGEPHPPVRLETGSFARDWSAKIAFA